MNAAVELEREVLTVHESRDFRSYHAFLRAARNYMEGTLVARMRDAYDAAVERSGRPEPASADAAAEVLHPLPEFRLYCWYFRHLQRFKYSRPDLGIVDTVNRERERLVQALESTAAHAAPGELRLDPTLEPPEYFRMVDFHQHPGGVAHDPLDGVVYEIGRRTTVPQHADPNGIYRLLFEALPQRRYARVLDWGVGHGQGLLTWAELHPESECHGVDLSAPCLKLAHRRAVESGRRLLLSQQDLERLDYPDDHFDLVFFNFMLHELPPAHTPALLREACRVLKPGGLFAGHEFHLRPGDAFQNVVQASHAWLNNETYSVPWYATPIEEIAREAGFARVEVRPFERLIRSIPRAGGRAVSTSWWNLYVFEK